MPNGNNSVRPRLACEVSAGRVVAARSDEQGSMVEMHSLRQLPPGTVVPSLIAANVIAPEALRDAIANALGALSGRGRDVIAILPDAAVRIVLLDFDTLPERYADALGVVRFRLRKSLPFDVDSSAVSLHAYHASDCVHVVAAVVLNDVLREYETAFLEAGYSPGVVLPSTLAALGPMDASRPTLMLKVSDAITTLAVADQDQLCLIRTIEKSSEGPASTEELAEHAYPSMVFCQDNFGSAIERVLVAGIAVEKVAPALASHTNARVEELLTPRYISGPLTGMENSLPHLAGVAGALLA